MLRTAPAPDDGPLARAAGDEVVRRGVVQQRPEALDIRLGPLVVQRRRLGRLRQLDGEDHEGNAIKFSNQANELGIDIHTIGIGSDLGGLVPIRSGNNDVKD